MEKVEIFKVFIDGKIDHVTKSKSEAIWNLGAKFGGAVYNKLYDEKKITFTDNSVKVVTK